MKSMVGRYIIEEAHNIVWDNVYIIREYNNSKKLDALESLAILRDEEENRLNHNTNNILLMVLVDSSMGQLEIII